MALWQVVKFIDNSSDNETVETVPTSWIHEDEQHCYWPPFEKKDIEKAIKSSWSPNKQQWSVYKIKVLGSKQYDNFKVATAKASKAICVSDIDSQNESELIPDKKRKRKINKNFISSASEDDEDDYTDCMIPAYPNLPQSRPKQRNSSKSCLSVPNRVETTPRKSMKPISSTLSKVPGKLLEAQGQSSDLPEKVNEGSYLQQNDLCNSNEHEIPRSLDEEFKISSKTFSKVAKLTIMSHQMLLQQQKLLEEMRQMLAQLTMGELPHKNHDMNKALIEEVENFKRQNFPLKDEEGLERFENLISEPGKDQFKDSPVVVLSKEGSSYYKEAVRRIMGVVMTTSLALLYSFQGHKQKKKFSSKHLSKVIIEAVKHCSRDDNLLTKDIETEIAIWLAKAAERQKRAQNEV